jgi:hypothetical protein
LHWRAGKKLVRHWQIRGEEEGLAMARFLPLLLWVFSILAMLHAPCNMPLKSNITIWIKLYTCLVYKCYKNINISMCYSIRYCLYRD